MKKIIYLLAFIAVAFASCDPLSKTYKDIDAVPIAKTTFAVNVTTSYATIAAANAALPAILAASYNQYPDGSSANVVYSLNTNSVNAPDVTLSHIAYTLTTADYTFPGNTFPDLTSTGVLNYLAYKYPTPADYQLVVLTYVFFETGLTPSAGTTVTDSFMYLSGKWVKIYTISHDQYASVGRGLYDLFDSNTATGDLNNIQGYLNFFLKNDPSISLTAKIGQIQWVSYKYGTTLQEAVPMYFDGTNWASRYTSNFIKTNGVWVLNNIPVINYTLTTADYTTMGANTAIGSDAARASLIQFHDFDLSLFTSAEVDADIIAFITPKYPSPKTNQEVDISLKTFNPSGTFIRAYIFDGTKFVAK